MNLPPRVALVGFMGSGKTTVGRAIAARIGYRFIDSDEEIEARAKAAVPELFRDRGEAWFRRLEAEVVREALDQDGVILATGGGAFAQAECADTLRARSFVVHLECGFEEAFVRAHKQGSRPLLDQGRDAALALYAERKDKYARAHVTVDTTQRPPGDVVTDVLRLLTSP